jgi:hypothetical protein
MDCLGWATTMAVEISRYFNLPGFLKMGRIWTVVEAPVSLLDIQTNGYFSWSDIETVLEYTDVSFTGQ